jgi:hypothetical protein
MVWQALGVGPRFFSAARARRAGVVGCALALVACGGNAKDGERTPALGDLGNRVPGVFEFPEGGRDFRGAVEITSLPAAIDQTDAFWFLGCGGLIALHDGEARLYDSVSSGIPENVTYIAIDANNRKWLSGSVPGQSTLGVLEHGRFRTVLTSPQPTMIRAAGNGVIWSVEGATTLDAIALRRLSPTPEAEIALPTRAGIRGHNVITDHDGAVWLTVGLTPPRMELYRWSEGTWNGPFTRDAEGLLQYDVQQDALWSFVDNDTRNIRRVRWIDGGLQEQTVLGPPVAGAAFGGFDRDERELWLANGELLWMKDGVVSESQAIPQDIEWATVSWNESVYLYASSAVYRKEGAEIRKVFDQSDFAGDCP